MKHKKALLAIAKLIDEVTHCCSSNCCDKCQLCHLGLCISHDEYDDEDLTNLYNAIKERVE